jgi:endoglucanase
MRVWQGLRRGWLTKGVAGLLMSLATVGVVRAQDQLGFERAKHLRRGINLSMWYAQARDYSAERLASYTTPSDFKLVHELGFDHVRLSINPVPLMADAQTGALDPAAMARLDETVKQITSAGLVVVLDMHPEETWKKEVTMTDEGTALFFRYWKNFAQHYAGERSGEGLL